jgi:hypothetical protein
LYTILPIIGIYSSLKGNFLKQTKIKQKSTKHLRLLLGEKNNFFRGQLIKKNEKEGKKSINNN